MKARWLIMLLGANAGGGATVVSMAGYVEPKALRFYRKAVNGTLRTVTPHTDEFKSTVTTDGMSGFEGIIEGELLSPCELEHDESIVLVGNNMESIDLVGPADIAKDGRTECESKLGTKDSKKRNAWIGVLLGIAVNARRFLCSSEGAECRQGGISTKINFQNGSSGSRTYEKFFGKGSDLKRLKLSPEFFRAIGYEAIWQIKGEGFKARGGDSNNSKVGGIRKEYRNGGGRINEKICKDDKWESGGRMTIQKRKGGEKVECQEGVQRFNDAKYVYVVDAKPSEDKAAGFGDKWGKQNGSQGHGSDGHKESKTITFWWWHGADPDYDGSSCYEEEKRKRAECEERRNKTNLEVKRYWESAVKNINDKCVPIPRLMGQQGDGNKLELTMESIRCRQKEIREFFLYFLLIDYLKNSCFFES